MSSKTGQVTGSLKVVNAGASLSDLFGYSKEFEYQLQLEMQPNDFKITSLLYDSENDNVDDLPPPPMSITPTDRIQWTSELKERFTKAIKRLGGAERATPSNIFYLMNVTEGLTLDYLKSHLQTYRHTLDRESTKISTSAISASGTLDAEGPRKGRRSASVALDPEGQSKPRTANKRSKAKEKSRGCTLDKKMRYEEDIQKLHEAENCNLEVSKCFSVPTIGNSEQVTDFRAIQTLSNNFRNGYAPCASNLIQQQSVTIRSPVEGCSLDSDVLQLFSMGWL